MKTTSTSTRYVPPSRRHGLAVRKRRPVFDAGTAHFPSLGGNADRQPTTAPELGNFLAMAAEKEAAEDPYQGVDESYEEPGSVLVSLPIDEDDHGDTLPHPTHYMRAARRMLSAVQAKRDLETRILGVHSEWWDSLDVRAPLAYAEEADLRPWGWEEGEAFEGDSEDEEYAG